MEGKRVQNTDSYKPGDYGKHLAHGIWYACTPNGLLGNLSNHEVTEHEDGTITVTPSILVEGADEGGNPISWHGFLEYGSWREV